MASQADEAVARGADRLSRWPAVASRSRAGRPRRRQSSVAAHPAPVRRTAARSDQIAAEADQTGRRVQEVERIRRPRSGEKKDHAEKYGGDQEAKDGQDRAVRRQPVVPVPARAPPGHGRPGRGGEDHEGPDDDRHSRGVVHGCHAAER